MLNCDKSVHFLMDLIFFKVTNNTTGLQKETIKLIQSCLSVLQVDSGQLGQSVAEEPDPTSSTVSATGVPIQTAPPSMDSELQVQAYDLFSILSYYTVLC